MIFSKYHYGYNGNFLFGQVSATLNSTDIMLPLLYFSEMIIPGMWWAETKNYKTVELLK